MLFAHFYCIIANTNKILKLTNGISKFIIVAWKEKGILELIF